MLNVNMLTLFNDRDFREIKRSLEATGAN